MTTAQDILDLFEAQWADIGFGTSETALARSQRIAGEVNRGERTIEDVQNSIRMIAERGGNMVATTDDIINAFDERNIDIGFNTNEDAATRAARIAQEISSGTRTWSNFQDSLSWLGQQGGTKFDTSDSGRRELELTYGWLPSEALDAYLDEYIESGNSDAAWAVIRQDPRYGQWFPGNMTEDGRPRYSEEDYATVVASYDDVFRAVGLNPELFKGRYGELIEGEVAPDELEKNRIMPMYDRIVEGSSAIKQWYSENYGLELTTEALLASSLDPDVGHKILTKQIGLAEIGGEARESGFGIAEGFAEKLYEAGMNRESADQMFQNAETFVPVLNVLAQRSGDPDDDFDLQEFVSADLFGDPAQRRRMNRLVAQERSTFTGGQLGSGAAQSRATGGVTGLTER